MGPGKPSSHRGLSLVLLRRWDLDDFHDVSFLYTCDFFHNLFDVIEFFNVIDVSTVVLYCDVTYFRCWMLGVRIRSCSLWVIARGSTPSLLDESTLDLKFSC